MRSSKAEGSDEGPRLGNWHISKLHTYHSLQPLIISVCMLSDQGRSWYQDYMIIQKWNINKTFTAP